MRRLTNLKVLRLKKGMKAIDLAYSIGVSPATLSLWENGFKKVPLDMAIKIAGVLGCSLEELKEDIREEDQANTNV